MGEIRLDNCCRLCLKEGFSLTNIFSHRSAAGDPLYRILNCIYDIKIDVSDGLPSQICSPCMWRMIEFDACKKNVRSAEAEIIRLLYQTRPNLGGVYKDGLVEKDEETTMDGACEFEEEDIESDSIESEDRASEVEGSENVVNADDMLQIKDEIDIEEWEMPKETSRSCNIACGFIHEAVQKFEEDDCDALESTEVEADKVRVEEFQDNSNRQVFCQPLRGTPGSSDLKNISSLEASEGTVVSSVEGESSSICTTQGLSVEIRDTNQEKHEKDLRDNMVPEEESLSSEMSKSIQNVRKSGWSNLKGPLSKSRFICDICKKAFTRKWVMGNHVRVHYDERPFSCNICDKAFKTCNVMYAHRLRHLRCELNFGKSEKGSKKNQYNCGICAKNFSTKNSLRMHFNTHNDKFKCTSCGKCFGKNANLRRHTRIHTKEKPFKCEVCFKCFNQKSNLKSHLLIHSSEKPFFCDICEKRFKSKAEKTRHELYHFRKK